MVARIGWSLLPWGAVLLALGPAPAFAQPSTAAEGDAPNPEPTAETTDKESGASDDENAARDQARMLFAKGLENFRAGRYKDAIDEFLEAHSIYPNPVLSFNAALAYEKMGDSAGALRFYREYLRQDPAAGDRDQVEQQISVFERKLQDKGLQQVTIFSTPEGATVRIDGRPVGVTPWTGELNPGRHALRLRLEGYQDARRQFELLAHRSLDVAVALDTEVAPLPSAAPPPAPPAAEAPANSPSAVAAERPRARIRPLTPVTLGAGAVTLGVAAVFESLRQSSENEVREADTQLARHDAFDQMESRQTTARILVGVGAAVTVAGGALLTLDLTRERPGPATTLSCGPHGCSLRGRF